MLDTGYWMLDAGWAESSKLKAESSEMEGVGCQDMKVSGVRCRVSGYEGVRCQVPGIQDSSGKIQGGYRSDGYGCKMQDTAPVCPCARRPVCPFARVASCLSCPLSSDLWPPPRQDSKLQPAKPANGMQDPGYKIQGLGHLEHLMLDSGSCLLPNTQYLTKGKPTNRPNWPNRPTG